MWRRREPVSRGRQGPVLRSGRAGDFPGLERPVADETALVRGHHDQSSTIDAGVVARDGLPLELSMVSSQPTTELTAGLHVDLSLVSLRQESSGKEEETRTRKPFDETLRVRIPPGKAGPAARSESCVVVGQPILRSVDSQVKGRVIEPRKLLKRVEPSSWTQAGAVSGNLLLVRSACLILPGSKSTDNDHQGFQGT